MRHLFVISTLLFGCLSSNITAAQQVKSPAALADDCPDDIKSRITSSIVERNYGGAFAAAEDLERAAETHFGEESRCYADALAQRAVVLQLLDRGAEAGPLFEQALALFRKYAPPDDPKLTLTLNNLGVHHFQMRQYEEAARAHEEALELRRKHKPLDEVAVAESLHNLADAYRYLGRPPGDVLKLYQEALDIKTRVLKPNDVSIGQTRQNLASAQELLNDLDGASRNLEQALALYRRVLPPDDPRIAAVINRQALVQFMKGADREAEVNFREALRLYRAAGTAPKSTLAATLDDFALNQMRMGHLQEAKLLASEALETRRAVFPENHPTIARTLSNLSYLAWLERDYGESLRLAREASDITIANGRLDIAGRLRLQRHLLAAWAEGTSKDQAPSPTLADEAFVIGQRAIRSDTAATVSRMALRFSAGNADLRQLLKAVDDIDRELAGLDESLTHSLTLALDQSNAEFSNIRAAMAARADQRKVLLSKIQMAFPDYARLINPEPFSSHGVQALLEPDEALLMFVVGYEDIHIWCITRDEVIWRKLDLSPKELGATVGTLRASLEIEPEDKAAGVIRQPLFDLGLAHELYAKLLGAVASVIARKSELIVVPSGPLTSLPLHLLVSSKPPIPKPNRQQPIAFRDADWLAKRFAISVLPSVESLDTLRRRAKPSAGRKAMIGFANPLAGPTLVPSQAGQPVASAQRGYVRYAALRRGLPGNIWGKQAADYGALRSFLANNPLQNSERELLAVGRILGADAHDLFTGANATETAVKRADLASYRVVYFATHGYVAGAFDQSEPALALTVPEAPNEFDDGLLTASEIAQLTLDADWVILSACDTAAGAGKGAEGLSGLARAFFHAGARALLVSQWSLDDASAMELMTDMFGRLRADEKLGRSQAFRQAMLSQIQVAGKGNRVWDAYPGRWAVFEMIGVD